MAVDPYREHRTEYAATRPPALTRVPRAKYLTISGANKPGSADFRARMQALFGAAYTMKRAERKAGRDFRVAPPGGLYWPSRRRSLSAPPAGMRWKLIDELHVEPLTEGTCVQALHVVRVGAAHHRSAAGLRQGARARAGLPSARDLPERPAPGRGVKAADRPQLSGAPFFPSEGRGLGSRRRTGLR